MCFLLVFFMSSASAGFWDFFKKIFGFDGKISIDDCGEFSYTAPVAVTASSSTLPGYPPENAIDGKTGMPWLGINDNKYPKWIYFDLGEEKCVNEVSIAMFPTHTPLKMDIQTSNNPEEIWENVVSDWDYDTEHQSNFHKQAFDVVKARYVRVYQTEGTSPFGSIGEIRITAADYLS